MSLQNVCAATQLLQFNCSCLLLLLLLLYKWKIIFIVSFLCNHFADRERARYEATVRLGNASQFSQSDNRNDRRRMNEYLPTVLEKHVSKTIFHFMKFSVILLLPFVCVCVHGSFFLLRIAHCGIWLLNSWAEWNNFGGNYKSAFAVFVHHESHAPCTVYIRSTDTAREERREREK